MKQICLSIFSWNQKFVYDSDYTHVLREQHDFQLVITFKPFKRMEQRYKFFYCISIFSKDLNELWISEKEMQSWMLTRCAAQCTVPRSSLYATHTCNIIQSKYDSLKARRDNNCIYFSISILPLLCSLYHPVISTYLIPIHFPFFFSIIFIHQLPANKEWNEWVVLRLYCFSVTSSFSYTRKD